MRTSGMHLFLAALAAAAPCGAETAQPEIRADRSPLTFRDAGLYCNYRMVHGIEPETEGLTNMLSAERAASPDSPWTFYIMQYHAPEKPRAEYDGAIIRAMAENGKKVLLRAGVGHMHQDPNVDEMEARLASMFQEVDPDWLYGITLDEEQVYWHGWGAALAELYHRCKQRWPELPVYQWWSPMEVPNVRSDGGWSALPADGWVIDLYGRPQEEFEKKVVMCLETGKPLVHIAWASPDWPAYSGAASWDDGGRQIFDDQREVCRAYNVPVAYFCTQKSVERDGERIKPIRWGWHAPDPVVRAWYRELEALVMNLPYLPDDQIGFRTPDQRLFDWAHGSLDRTEMTYVLDDEGRKRFAWRPYLSDAPLEPGEHTVERPYDNPHARLTLVLDQAASGLDGGLTVRGVEGYANRVPLVFRVEPLRPVRDMRVTARVTALKVLGGFAHLAVSADGTTWSDPVSNDPARTSGTLTSASPIEGESDAPFWARVTLECLAGKPTNPAASLRWLEVSAAFEPPL